MQITPSERTGAAVRLLMRKRNKTQQDLADRMGLQQSAISSRLRGAIAFDINELVIVAEFLDVPLSALLPDSDRVAS
jgi:transcriptional regulator with XRE-family HTH domain